MQTRSVLAVTALMAAAALAGCGSSGGGGGGGTGPTVLPTTTPPGPGPTPTPTPVSTPNLVSDSIAAMNAAGSPVLADQDLETAQSSPRARGGTPPINQCTPLQSGGPAYKFLSPVNGNANSTERVVYYDPACQQIATDAVRTVTGGGGASSTETVTRTLVRYATSGQQIASRNETDNYSNAPQGFDSYGYPVVDTGLVRSSQASITLTPQNSTKTFSMNQNDEFIVANNSSPVLTFCADTAGVNALGNFGVQNQTSNATITQNNDGSVTFGMTRAGSLFTGSSMALQLGTPNTSCPITKPGSAVMGSVSQGAYSMPNTTITIANINDTAIPAVVDMEVPTATFPNGETLTVSTKNPGSSPVVITGTLSNSAGTVSTFTVDGWGTGVLTVNSTPSTTFNIVQWHVAAANP